jgi:hypothetical protein
VTILEFFLWSLLKVAVVTVVMLLGVAYTVLLERKLVGRIQNRWGPNRRLQAAVPACADSGPGVRADIDRRYSFRRAEDRTAWFRFL